MKTPKVELPRLILHSDYRIEEDEILAGYDHKKIIECLRKEAKHRFGLIFKRIWNTEPYLQDCFNDPTDFFNRAMELIDETEITQETISLTIGQNFTPWINFTQKFYLEDEYEYANRQKLFNQQEKEKARLTRAEEIKRLRRVRKQQKQKLNKLSTNIEGLNKHIAKLEAEEQYELNNS